MPRPTGPSECLFPPVHGNHTRQKGPALRTPQRFRLLRGNIRHTQGHLVLTNTGTQNFLELGLVGDGRKRATGTSIPSRS